MKHYGKHEFPQEADIQLGIIFDAFINNKLNLPLHRDVNEIDFGDIFVESNAVKFVNFEKLITELLSLGNNDLIKSLLLSEVFFDCFLNFEEDRASTESFHEDIDLNTNLIQHRTTNNIIDCLVYDSTLHTNSICIELYNFANENDIISIQNMINAFIEYDLSLRCTFYNGNTNLFESMVLFTDTYYDTTASSLKLYTDASSINNDVTNANGIILHVYNIDLTSDKLYVKLPHHKHLVEELSDLASYTNTPNGYPRLNNYNLRLPFNWYLWLVWSKIENSLFLKEQIDEFKKENCFVAEYNTQIIKNVNYSEEEVVMQDDTVTEYTYIDMTIDFDDVINFRIVSNNWKLKNTYNNSVYDDTAHNDKYLCEFLHIDLNNIVSEGITNIKDILDVTYTQIDKTTVESGGINVYDIDFGNGVIDIFNGYYNVEVLQASPSTIPSVVMQYTNLCKDDYNKVFVTKPIRYRDLLGTKSLVFVKDSDLLVKYENEASPMTIDVYKFNVFKSDQVYVMTLTANDSILYNIFPLNRGMYEFRPSSSTDYYNIYLLERV